MLGEYQNRGQSTDVSSVPKSLANTNSDLAASDVPYVQVRLTKDILHVFEEVTRTRTTALIEAYLGRCEQEPGEIDGLLTSSSSSDRSPSSISKSDQSESNEEEGESEESEEQDPIDRQIDGIGMAGQKQRKIQLIEALEQYGSPS